MLPLRYSLSMAGTRIRTILTRMVVRYLPSEIAGTITALGAAGAVYFWSGSLVAAALAGSFGEAVGYYGMAGLREIRHQYERHRHHQRAERASRTATDSLRGMIVEFGPAESVDSLFVRPLLFYVIPRATGTTWLGWLAAKLCADLVFYALIAISYELRKKHQA